MKIGNIEINTNMKTILDKLILECRSSGLNYFSKGYKTLNGYYSVQCPYHKMGQERHPSAQFRISDGLFYCFGCKETHSLPDVISYCLDVNGRAWLLENFDGTSIEERKVVFNIPKREVTPVTYVDKSILANYRYTHPYMFKRKLNLDTIRKFDIGYDKDNDCITFPNKDINGNILFIATRSVNTKFFHYPDGVDKPIYGLYEIYREMRKGVEINEVYICESMINCLTLWSWGKYAVALNGTGSQKQYDMLRRSSIRHFILALDPDDAGIRGTVRLYKALYLNKIIDVLPVPKGKDINDLTYEEFSELKPTDIIKGYL